jgi:hypothetical protein
MNELIYLNIYQFFVTYCLLIYKRLNYLNKQKIAYSPRIKVLDHKAVPLDACKIQNRKRSFFSPIITFFMHLHTKIGVER